MEKIEFNWEYLTGLKTSQLIVRKYKDKETGAIKEELIKAEDKSKTNLYYLPGDIYTYHSEEKLRARIKYVKQNPIR